MIEATARYRTAALGYVEVRGESLQFTAPPETLPSYPDLTAVCYWALAQCIGAARPFEVPFNSQDGRSWVARLHTNGEFDLREVLPVSDHEKPTGDTSIVTVESLTELYVREVQRSIDFPLGTYDDRCVRVATAIVSGLLMEFDAEEFVRALSDEQKLRSYEPAPMTAMVLAAFKATRTRFGLGPCEGDHRIPIPYISALQRAAHDYITDEDSA